MQIKNSNTGSYRDAVLYGQGKKQTDSVKDTLRSSIREAFDYTEEKEQQLSNDISAKMKIGAKLTPEELIYLQRKNPMLYTKYLMLQKKKEILEKRLKNCKSKQEVNDVINQEISMLQKNDPDRELKLKVIKDTEKEYKQTGRYQHLPVKTEEKNSK